MRSKAAEIAYHTPRSITRTVSSKSIPSPAESPSFDKPFIQLKRQNSRFKPCRPNEDCANILSNLVAFGSVVSFDIETLTAKPLARVLLLHM